MIKIFKFISLFIITLSVIPRLYAGNTILFLGDSLTEGHNLSKEFSYPTVVGNMLSKKGHKDIKILNGGVSGSTTASGLSRLRWFMKAKPNILVLALGANDGLRGTKLESTEKNLRAIVTMAQANKIKVILCGMMLPPNYGKSYTQKFSKIFLDISKEYKLKTVPFLLKGVAGNKELNLADGIHPNEKGYEVVAKNILEVLEKEL